MYILFADTAFLVTIVDADEVAYVVSESSCLRVSHLSLCLFLDSVWTSLVCISESDF